MVFTICFAVTKFLVATGYYWETRDIVSQSEVLEVTNEGGHPCHNWVDMKVSSATGGLLNNTPLICGGESFTRISNTCYSLKENAVMVEAQMLANRTNAASIVYNENFIWITGGVGNWELSLIHSSSEFIQTGKNNSVAGSNLPRPLYWHAMVVVEEDLTMVIGGLSLYDTEDSNVTYYYDHHSQEWTSGPLLITGRYGHAAFFVTDEVLNENMILVAGGFYLETLNSTEILHGDIWIEGKDNFIIIL